MIKQCKDCGWWRYQFGSLIARCAVTDNITAGGLYACPVVIPKNQNFQAMSYSELRAYAASHAKIAKGGN